MADKIVEKKAVEDEVPKESAAETENQFTELTASQRRILDELHEVHVKKVVVVQEKPSEMKTFKEVVGESPNWLSNGEEYPSGSKYLSTPTEFIDCDDMASFSDGLKRKLEILQILTTNIKAIRLQMMMESTVDDVDSSDNDDSKENSTTPKLDKEADIKAEADDIGIKEEEVDDSELDSKMVN